MADTDYERITLKFDGGLASTGKLDFYEFGRSQYAFARFIATIEHFRRSGEVAEHIGRRTYVDITVSSPERGSFLETILVPAVLKAGTEFVATRLSSLLSYVWHLISPRREKTDETVKELALIRLAEERTKAAKEGTKQEKERSKQEGERTAQLKILQSIAEGEHAAADRGLELVKWALSTPNVAVGRLEITKEDYEEMADELRAEVKRLAEFRDSEDELKKIDEDTLNKLTSRLRPMIPEMTLPLRRSAKTMYLGPSATDRPYIFINDEIAKSLLRKESAEEVSDILGRVRSYDRDAGVGKFSSDELPRVLNFLVPLRERDSLRDKILEAMRMDEVVLRVRKVVDQSGLPTSLILTDVILLTQDSDDQEFET
jgi:hypothetical protein